jgi:adenosine kinase
VIVTLGEKGSLIWDNGVEYPIPVAEPARIADPTGVGDAYRAGLISGMMRGYPWGVAGRLGAVVAAYVLEQHGTQRHSYTRRQVAQRYREAFGDAPELADFIQ